MRAIAVLLVFVVAWLAPRPLNAGFVERSKGTVAWAIRQSQSTMARATAERYAQVLLEVAREQDFDPFTGVAIVHHESRWHASAVSADGEDYGLGQIRARFQPGCRDDDDPVNAPDAECKAAKARLLSPAYNLKMMGAAISAWRRLCKSTKTGTGRPALFHRWLAGYGGMHRPKAGIRCGQKKAGGKWRDLPIRPALRRIIDYRKRLIRQLRQRRRRR